MNPPRRSVPHPFLCKENEPGRLGSHPGALALLMLRKLVRLLLFQKSLPIKAELDDQLTFRAVEPLRPEPRTPIACGLGAITLWTCRCQVRRIISSIPVSRLHVIQLPRPQQVRTGSAVHTESAGQVIPDRSFLNLMERFRDLTAKVVSKYLLGTSPVPSKTNSIEQRIVGIWHGLQATGARDCNRCNHHPKTLPSVS